jgi:hypothetical protein
VIYSSVRTVLYLSREGWVKSKVTGRSGAYERCNTGQLYALVRRQAAARRQDPIDVVDVVDVISIVDIIDNPVRARTSQLCVITYTSPQLVLVGRVRARQSRLERGCSGGHSYLFLKNFEH